MKTRILSTILFTLFSMVVFSQGKDIKPIPFKFTKPYDYTKLGIEKAPSTGKPWIVYSDRKNAQSYTESGGSTVFKTLDFLDPFYVLDETEEYVHIYKDSKAYTQLTPQAEDYGWVRKDNLLLWQRALNNKNDIQKKAMILNTEESVKKALERGLGSIVKFNEDPTLRVPNDKFANIYTIFYVYKLYPDNINPTAALLGSRAITEQGTVKDDIWGWVSYAKITPWDHRVATLPSTDERSLEERKRLNSPALIFCDEVEAKKFKDQLPYSKNCVFWQGDKFDRQYIGQFMRSPVLDDIDAIQKRKGVMKVGFIGRIEGENTTMDPKEWAVLQKMANNLQAKTRNINIVFVIDGTTSMGPYFLKVSDAIISCMQQIKERDEYKYNNIRFAAIVYRDYAEGDRLVEMIKLTSNVKDVADQLRAVKALDYADKDVPEAVYYGIKYAIQALRLPPDQNNNLFLIGDAGNHSRQDPSQVPVDSIVSLVTQSNYNFFAFQVHNDGTAPYMDFISQAKGIIEKVGMNQYKNALTIANPMKAHISPPKIPLPIDGTKRLYYLDKPYVYGGVYYLLPKTTLQPEVLQKRIISEIISISDSTNSLLKQVNEIMMGKGIDSTSSSPFWNHLAKMGVPPENLAILKSEHYQIYAKGYTSLERKGLSYPLWEYQLFYTLDDLHDLKSSITKLINARTGDERREKFVEAWKTLLKGHIGNLGVEEIENKYVEELEKLVFGLPGTSEFLRLRLRDLSDPAKLSDGELDRWITRIQSNLKRIENIYNGVPAFAEYSFLSNDQRYFWIPQSFLP